MGLNIWETAVIARYGNRSAIEVTADNMLHSMDVYHIRTLAGHSRDEAVEVHPVGEPEILEAERTNGLPYSHHDRPSSKDIIRNMPRHANAYCLGEIVQVGRCEGGLTWCTIHYHRMNHKIFLEELKKAGKKSSKKK